MSHIEQIHELRLDSLRENREYPQGYFRNLRERRIRNALQVLEEEEQEELDYIEHV